MPGVIYVASIDSHGVQWTCTLFTTLQCQKVRSRVISGIFTMSGRFTLVNCSHFLQVN